MCIFDNILPSAAFEQVITVDILQVRFVRAVERIAI